MLFFKTKQNVGQIVSRLMDQVWHAVVTNGSQELAVACNIQGEWLTKEMLALSYSGAIRALQSIGANDWQTHRDQVQSELGRLLVQELVSFLNEIEWQVGPWLDGAKGSYSQVPDADGAGAVFFNRVAATENSDLVRQGIVKAGAATYQAAYSAVSALPKKFKVI